MRLYYAHSGNLLYPSANIIQVVRMCEAFSKVGCTTTLFYPQYVTGNVVQANKWREYYGVEDNFEIRPLATPLTRQLSNIPLFLPLLKSIGYLLEVRYLIHQECLSQNDVIYARCFLAARFFSLLRRFLPKNRRFSLFLEAHEMPSGLRSVVLRHVDGIVAITNSLKKDLIKQFRLAQHRVRVAPDGVPETWCTQVSLSKEKARKIIGLETDSAMVVYTGRLYQDSIKSILEMAKHIQQDIHIVLVGPPEESWSSVSDSLSALNQKIQSRGYNHITIVGPVSPSKVRYYHFAADLLLIPYTERLRTGKHMSPIKVFEYMASGRPIVAFELPVLCEILRHKKNAYLVSEISGKALADGISVVLNDPELQMELGRRAREEAHQYTWTVRAKRILNFITILKRTL